MKNETPRSLLRAIKDMEVQLVSGKPGGILLAYLGEFHASARREREQGEQSGSASCEPKRAYNKRAFTLAEIMVVVGIMLILTAAAFSASGGVIRNLRINNVFNKMVLLVQQARNAALTGKGNSDQYTVEFVTDARTPNIYTVALFNDNGVDGRTLGDANIDSLTITAAESNVHLWTQDEQSTQCGDPGVLLVFKKGTGDLRIYCGTGVARIVPFVTICLKAEAATTAPCLRSFTIHSASGIPQTL